MPTPITLTYTSSDGSAVRRTYRHLVSAQVFAEVLVGERPKLELDLPIPRAVSVDGGSISIDAELLTQLFPDLDPSNLGGAWWEDFGPEFEAVRDEEAQAREDAYSIQRAETERCPFAVQAVRPRRCSITDGIVGSSTRTLARFSTESEAHTKLVELCRENTDEDGAPYDDEVIYRLRAQRWVQDEWKSWRLTEAKGDIELEQERKWHEDWVAANLATDADGECLF